MYTAIKGIYENGEITLEETPPTAQRSKVLVMFISDEWKSSDNLRQGVKLGSLSGLGYGIPDDFNEPLDDLMEYM